MLLATYIRPFDAKQKIYVLDNKKNTEEIVLTDLGNYAKTVMELTLEYNVDEIELHGNEDICRNVKEEVLREEFAKYNNNELKITLKGAE